jgi:hypothetical protein
MSEGGAGEWFFTVNGQQKGPVSREELGHLAKAGAIHPRTDVVWTQGMEKWRAAGEIDGLFERRKADEPVAPAAQMAATASSAGVDDPYGLGEDPDFHRDATSAWPGVGRGGYIMATMVLPIGGQLAIGFIAGLAAGMLGERGAAWLAIGGGVALLLIALYAVIERFPNLGMSRWWVLGLLVPGLNWWLGYRALACPPGYAYNRKLDAIGWVLAVLYWLTIVAGLAVLVALIVMVGSALLDPEKWQEILKQIEVQAG